MEELLALSAISVVGAASFGTLYYTTKRKFKHFKT